MNINDLTIGDFLKLKTIFNDDKFKNSENINPCVGRDCVVRTFSAGVHIGIVEYVLGSEVLLKNSRRLYNWKGAFTLSEVSQNGINKDSRMAIEIPLLFLSNAIELIPTSEKARISFALCKE